MSNNPQCPKPVQLPQSEVEKTLEKHKEIALKYIETIKSNHRIIAVVGLGSLARRYADEISDIDLGIIFIGKTLPVPQGEFLFEGYDIDILLINVDYYRNTSAWPSWMRETFSSAIILYSRDEKITERSLRKHVAPKTKELQYLTTDILLDLAWHGIHVTDIINYGTPYKLPSDGFLVKRAGPLGTMIYYDFALQQVLRLFFIANRSFPPTPKWLLYQLPMHDTRIDKRITNFMKSCTPYTKRKELVIFI
ncbi:MAG: hypothetical protein MPEBLZ_03229 [Candidatus Methanoperedens nitroreducens]|uniref:Polymerase beta nucleotidyltransferase domain-containing protein n=1 Tax=Candidatus Methanoperedens nitratireducens TaxID=1392998 RepID=A0A0P7ZC65_9EURY|nr:MAG: hypothetical protein MPEBLZ_03229 [Candidatus Methanoperedens sp. BLZ1]